MFGTVIPTTKNVMQTTSPSCRNTLLGSCDPIEIFIPQLRVSSFVINMADTIQGKIAELEAEMHRTRTWIFVGA
jgi:hypothetical protein